MKSRCYWQSKRPELCLWGEIPLCSFLDALKPSLGVRFAVPDGERSRKEHKGTSLTGIPEFRKERNGATGDAR